MASTRAEEYGLTVEQTVARNYDGERTPGEWYDVETEEGDVLESKSCLAEHSTGRKGRWRVWKEQHERLKQVGGAYVLTVTKKTDDGEGVEIVTSELVTPHELDEILAEHGYQWTGAGSHPMRSQQVKVQWDRVVDPDEVDR